MVSTNSGQPISSRKSPLSLFATSNHRESIGAMGNVNAAAMAASRTSAVQIAGRKRFVVLGRNDSSQRSAVTAPAA
jgi:hypothetical protein